MLLAYLAASWVAGIVVGNATDPPWYVPVFVGLSGLAVVCFNRRDRRLRVVAACALALALGTGRVLLASPRLNEASLASHIGSGRVSVQGVVVDEPDERQGYTDLRLRAETLVAPGGPPISVQGLALVRGPRYPRRNYGDRLIVAGTLETPPSDGSFSYRDYLSRQGIRSMFSWSETTLLVRNQASPIRSALLGFKGHARTVISNIMREPEASLLAGVLLGLDSGIPRDLMEDFRVTGTAHVIAVSGFNLTLVAGIASGLAWRIVGRRRAFFVATAAIVVYSALVGASPAVLRAAVMAFLYLWARYLGRASSAPVSMGAAAIVMTARNPFLLWDVSFQLSFASTLGLMVYVPLLDSVFGRLADRAGSRAGVANGIGMLGGVLAPTLAATVTTMPLIAHHFGQLSTVTLLANTAILPVQPHVMALGGLATLGGLIAQPLGQVLAWAAWPFLAYTIGAVRILARFPFASVSARMPAGAVVAYYVLLGAVTAWFSASPEQRTEVKGMLPSRPWVRALAAASLAGATLIAGWWAARPDGRLHVTFLDVGQGDAIFIQTPSGRQVLIDGGPSESALLDQLGRQMPFWDRTLDVVLLTHPDLDHLTGLLPVLERYRVGRIVYREADETSAEYERWLGLVTAEGADAISGDAGLILDLGEGLRMTALHPPAGYERSGGEDHNNASIVIRLTYGDVSILLTGDVEASVERQLLSKGAVPASTILKLAHHGSCTSSTPEFLAAVAPDAVVISVGENDFGHPCGELLQRLEDLSGGEGDGLGVYRTDQDGAVEFTTDGAEVWVRTDR